METTIMAFIKSALEIALERTKDVKSDPDTIKSDNLVKEGQKLASDYLNNTDDDLTDLEKKIKSFSDDNKKFFIEGLKKTFLSNLRLPKTNNYEDLLNKIMEGFSLFTTNKKDATIMVEQIKQFFSQYLENRSQLIEAVKQQYAPRLMQKQQEMAERYGQEVTLTPDQDPEFMELLKSNLVKLETQYGESLSKAKEELEKIL
jgi:uncharacterized protein YlaN (UPF0358 family)